MPGVERLRLRVSRAAQEQLRQLNARGFDVYAPEDFSEIPALVAATGRGAQTPMFALERNDFTRADAFWLFLMRGSDCVGGIAAKRQYLVDESFEGYLRRTSAQQYGRPDGAIKSVAPLANRIRGRVIYIGELHLRADTRGSPQVLIPFTQLAKSLAVLEWEFDWIYSLLYKQFLRLLPDYGYNFFVKDAITWHEPAPEGRSNDHVLAAVDYESFSHHC